MREMRAAARKITDQYLGNLGEMDQRTEVTETLSSKCGSHHTTTNPGRSKLGGDDGRKWVVTTDTDTHLVTRSAQVLERKSGEMRLTMKRQTTRTPMIWMAGAWPERA